jgi:multimeric flavodoxin WrbA
MDIMKIVAIVGSPRMKGNTSYLVDKALEEAAKNGVQTEKIMLARHDLRPCLGHDNCASYKVCTQNDDAPWILERFCEADAVILATPVYWYNVTAQMKTFIDRNYFIYQHGIQPRAKAVGIIIAAEMEGIEDTLNTLRKFAEWTFPIPKDRIISVTGYANKMGEAEENTSLVNGAISLGRQLADILLENGKN